MLSLTVYSTLAFSEEVGIYRLGQYPINGLEMSCEGHVGLELKKIHRRVEA